MRCARNNTANHLRAAAHITETALAGGLLLAQRRWVTRPTKTKLPASAQVEPMH